MQIGRNDNKGRILVTGATGRQGGTGRGVAKWLIERGYRVRTLVRKRDERAEYLGRLGAEVVVGDYADYASLLVALEDVESAYFCYPVAAGIAEAAGLFAAAGRKQGLKRVVDISLAATGPEHPSPQARAQWVAEQIFEWAGFAGVHLRIAAFFMENVLVIDLLGIREKARIANPFGTLGLPWIAGEDVGAIAANLLVDSSLTSERVVVVGGGELMTYPEVAQMITNVVGKRVSYEELTPEAWRAELIAGSARQGEPNVRGADHLVAQSIALKRGPGPPVTDHVRQFAGRTPISFAHFIETHRAQLTPVI